MHLPPPDLLSLLASRTTSPPDFAGNYTSSYLLSYEGSSLLARLPHPASEPILFDPRMLSEAEALSFASFVSPHTPRVLFSSPSLLVETFCPGTLLDLSSPSWLPSYAALTQAMASIHAADPSPLFGPDTQRAWWDWMEDFISSLWTEVSPLYSSRYEAVGLSAPDLLPLWEARRSLPGLDHPTSLVHADLHPGNVLVESPSRVWILDWELAQKADPLWDVAVALHRTPWLDSSQAETARSLWLSALAPHLPHAPHTEVILGCYLHLERWKSVLVDTIRYPEALRSSDSSPLVLTQKAKSLHQKLLALDPASPLSLAEVTHLLSTWSI